ncbi:MAG: cysteine--tRNA ligase, partial [bacterium]|nr:cysteine--tRNA ligase [bacterium]
KAMEYSEAGIKAAQNGLEHLYNQARESGKSKSKINKKYQEKFLLAINDDLNTPRALAIVQEVLKSKLSDKEKLATVLNFDKVLGLNLKEAGAIEEISEEVSALVNKREEARKNKNWAESDRLRAEIEKQGYTIKDTKDGQRIVKK